MKGIHLETAGAGYVAEYFSRKRLAKLGYTSSLGELSTLKGQIFVTIDSEIDSLQAKAGAKHGRR